MHAGLLDVLHDPADPHVLAVAQGVDVDLGASSRKRSRKIWRSWSTPTRFVEVVAQGRVVVDDLHRPAAEHVGRPHEQREPDRGRALQRVADRVEVA